MPDCRNSRLHHSCSATPLSGHYCGYRKCGEPGGISARAAASASSAKGIRTRPVQDGGYTHRKMPEEDKLRSERMPPWVVGWGAGLLGGIAVAVLAVVLLFWLAPGTRLAHLLGALLGESPTRVELDQPAVVRQVQQLRRLETVIYQIGRAHV